MLPLFYTTVEGIIFTDNVSISAMLLHIYCLNSRRLLVNNKDMLSLPRQLRTRACARATSVAHEFRGSSSGEISDMNGLGRYVTGTLKA